MENRERDRVSQRTSPTEAGKVNRRTEEEKGRDTGSSVEFGKNIGHSEDLDANSEGGMMDRNKNQQGNMENESSRRSGGESGYGSSTGRSSGSSGNMGGSSKNSDSNSHISDSGQSGSVGKGSGKQGSSQSDESDRS